MENWRPVVGYEGKYEVSDHGRVRSLDRMVWNNFKGDYVPWKGRVLKLKRKPSGHLSVALSSDGRLRDHYVHRLVLGAFVGPCPIGLEALHYDDNPENNFLSNLRWAARSVNIADRIRNGRRCNRKSTHCKAGHEYTDETVKVLSSGKRTCVICLRTYQREWKRKRKSTAKW